MRAIAYKGSYVRALKKLPTATQNKVIRTVALYAEGASDERLRVHKLKGRMKGLFSFSVGFDLRVIFQLQGKLTEFLDIGPHDVYE